MDFGKSITEVKFEDLEGHYPKDLLDALKENKIDKLKEVPEEDRKSREYMYPLLYAVKNKFDTYAVFKYYLGRIEEQDEELTVKVIQREPEVIEDTALSSDREFILSHANVSPQIVRYMHQDLKMDYGLVQGLCQLHNADVTKEVVSDPEIPIGPIIAEHERAANSSEQVNYRMSSDPTFISQGIATKGVDFIINASDELRNDYEFMKKESAQNEELIKYAAKNTKAFGNDGLKAICESSEKQTYDNAMDEINKKVAEESGKEDGDKRYKMVKERLEQSQAEGKEEPYAMRFAAAMAAQSKDTTVADLERYANYSTLMMEKIKRDVDEQGQLKTDFETMKQNIRPLIAPAVLNKLKNNLEVNGVEINSDLSAQLDEYISFYKDYFEKFNEAKRQKREKNEKTGKENDNLTQELKSDTEQKPKEVAGNTSPAVEEGFGPRDVAEATQDLNMTEVRIAAGELAIDVKDPTLEVNKDQITKEKL